MSGLPGPVRAEEPEDLAVADLEGHIVKGDPAAKSLGKCSTARAGSLFEPSILAVPSDRAVGAIGGHGFQGNPQPIDVLLGRHSSLQVSIRGRRQPRHRPSGRC